MHSNYNSYLSWFLLHNYRYLSTKEEDLEHLGYFDLIHIEWSKQNWF